MRPQDERPVAGASTEAVLVVGLSLGLALGAGQGAHGSRLKTGIERLMGRQAAAALRDHYGVCRSPTLTRWVQRIGERVVKQAPRHDVRWEFGILDTDSVNAFAAPAGFVFVTKGLLAAAHSEDEVAGVIAHEVGHIVDSHSWEQMLAQGGMLLLYGALKDDRHREGLTALAVVEALTALRLSREDELESDQWGVRLAGESGYDPGGMERFLDTLRWLEGTPPKRWEVLLSTHPPERTRRAAVQQSPWRRADDPTLLLARAQGLQERGRWLAARKAYRLAGEAGALTPGATSSRHALEQRLEGWKRDSVAPLTEATRRDLEAAGEGRREWMTRVSKQCETLRRALRRASRQRRDNAPLARVVFARLNPEDPIWLHVAWRVTFLQQKLGDALMKCGRVLREAQRLPRELGTARAGLLRDGAVRSVATDASRFLGPAPTGHFRHELDAALTEAETAGTLCCRAVVDLVPPLLALVDPTRSRSTRITRGRLLAAETTLLHAELATQDAWLRARRADRRLAAAGTRCALAQLAGLELSGRLPADQSRALARLELGVPADAVAAAPAPGQSIAHWLMATFPRLERLPNAQELPGPWLDVSSPVDLGAAWISVENLVRALREETQVHP